MSTDDTLVRQLRASPRDERLWSSLYQRCHAKVYGLTVYLCHANDDLAQDLTQDAFLRFITSGAIAKVSNSTAAIAYLRAIVRNLVRDHYRKHMQHPTVSTANVRTVDLENALNRLMRDSITEVDFAVFSDLREEDRVLLRLSIEGRSVAEVADQMGLTYSAAAVRLHRLRKNLRTTCKETTPERVMLGKKGGDVP